VSAASKVLGGPAISRLKRRALSLGTVKVFDQALNFLLPVVLVRCLDAATFGEYRLLWLTVGTVVAVATLNMGGSLYFFLPRADPRHKRIRIHNTLVYFAFAGALCGLAVSPWNPLLPAPMRPLAQYGWLVPAFVALWVAATLLDYLPTIEERIRWQARATLSASALRAVLVAAAAWASGELRLVLWLLLAAVLVKLALLLAYVRIHHGLGRPWFERATFSEQLRYSAPFGVSAGLFSLRGQSDQWVAASLFALSSFAAFTIAALVGQIVHIFRHSVMEAFLPTMSRMEAAGDVRGMLALNARANVMVGTLLYPLLAFAFAFAEDIVTIIYTSAYVEAGPVMRVYIAGMAAMVIEVGSIVLLLRQGQFSLKVNVAALALSVAVSWSAAHALGLVGAACGSVLAVYVDRALMLRRVAHHTGVPLRALQDWRALAWTLASAAASAALAWIVVEELLEGRSPLARLACGAALLAAAYGAANLRRLAR
jgi:O-antigen/teichoic acid export membrane protein